MEPDAEPHHIAWTMSQMRFTIDDIWWPNVIMGTRHNHFTGTAQVVKNNQTSNELEKLISGASRMIEVFYTVPANTKLRNYFIHRCLN